MKVTVVARIFDRAAQSFIEKDLKTFKSLKAAENYVQKCRKANPHIQFFYRCDHDEES